MGAGSSLTQGANTTGGNVNFLPTTRYTGSLAEENAAMQANKNAGTNTIANGLTAQNQPSSVLSPGAFSPQMGDDFSMGNKGSGQSFSQVIGGVSNNANMAMPYDYSQDSMGALPLPPDGYNFAPNRTAIDYSNPNAAKMASLAQTQNASGGVQQTQPQGQTLPNGAPQRLGMSQQYQPQINYGGQQGQQTGYGSQSSYQQPTTNSLQSFIGNNTNPYANSTNPYLQAANATTMGNLAGAQQATIANRINQNTPYASLNYTQGVDANGNPTWTANQQLAQPLQQSLNNIQGQLAQSTANPFDVSKFQGQTSQGFTGMEGWDKATGLINQRLQPQIEQSQERLQAQLANQGIVPGTEAYNRAMTLQGQKTNDLMAQAQLAGSQVQNQMQGQSLAQQQANNAALQQNYTQNLAAKNLPLNQLGAFQTATQPGYVNPYSQAAVSGPDYLGATATSNAAAIAQQNANIAKQNATTQGLYGLGGAALLGGGGLGNLGTSGTSGAGLLGLGQSAYNTLFGNSGMDLLNNSSSIQDYLTSIGATGGGLADQAMSTNDYLNDLYSGLNLF